MKLTFEHLKRLEPELERLEREIRALGSMGEGETLKLWYGWGFPRNENAYKPRMVGLVGWSRGKTMADPARAPQPDANGCLDARRFIDWPRIPNPRFHPQLGTSEAYDVAYQHLYDLLWRVTREGAA